MAARGGRLNKVVVVGGGVGGLAAAHRLRELSLERKSPLEVVVLEAAGRAGGVLGTETFEGVLLERGPDTIVTHKPAALDLCRRLGLGDRVAELASGASAVLDRGRLIALPPGFAILTATSRRALLTTPLLSLSGRLRALCEPWVRRGTEADESVASFVRRRFGDEFYRRLAEPVAGAIHLADLERLSLAAAFPRFQDLEREHGRVSGIARSGAPAPALKPAATLRGGLGQIADALLSRLGLGTLRLRTRAERVLRDDGGLMVDIDGHLLRADAVLLAVPAVAAAALLRDLAPALAAQLRAVPFASCATVHLAWPRRAIARWPSLQGIFVPRSAATSLVAATFVSNKFPDRVPEDLWVVRAFLGGALHTDTPESDEGLAALAAAALAPLLDVREPFLWSRVFRHPSAMPQPAVGYPRLRSGIQMALETQPGLELAGGPLGGYGLPDTVTQAEAAAERLFAEVV